MASRSSPLGHGRVHDDESSALERPALGHLARLLARLLVHLVDALRRRQEDPARHVGTLDPHVVPEGVEGAADLAGARRGQPTDPPAFVDTSALRTSDGPAADVVRRDLHAEKR